MQNAYSEGDQPATWWLIGYVEPFHHGMGRDLRSGAYTFIPGVDLLFLPLVLLPAPSLLAFPSILFTRMLSLTKEPNLQKKK